MTPTTENQQQSLLQTSSSQRQSPLRPQANSMTVISTVHPHTTFWLRNLGIPCRKFLTLRTSHNITINKDGIPNTISADSASLSSFHMQLQDDIVDDKYKPALLKNSVIYPGTSNGQPRQSKDNGSQTHEYTFNHIFKHVGNSR